MNIRFKNYVAKVEEVDNQIKVTLAPPPKAGGLEELKDY